MTAGKPRVRRTPAPWWFGALVAVPLVFGIIGAQAAHGSIERTLTTRSNSALQAAGVTDATVSFSGRDAAVRLGSQGSQDTVRKAVEAIPGVRTVVVTGGTP